MGIFHGIAALGLEVIPPVQQGDLLVAIDGGLSSLLAHDLTADLILGDFDSLGYVPTGDNIHQLPTQKDETDLAYAITQGKQRGYEKFFFQGALGGRLDHSMANIQLLLSLAKDSCPTLMLGEGQGALCLHHGSLTFPKGFQGYLSVFALETPATGVCLENLAYEGREISLFPTIPLGVSNEFLPEKSGKISVAQGSLLLMWQKQKGDYLSLLQGIQWEIEGKCHHF